MVMCRLKQFAVSPNDGRVNHDDVHPIVILGGARCEKQHVHAVQLSHGRALMLVSAHVFRIPEKTHFPV